MPTQNTTIAAQTTGRELRDLPICQVTANPDQPRKFFDTGALQELADSIAANGLLQPITVRPTGPDTYLIIAGERRYRASQLAELATIPAIILEMSNEVDSFVLSVLENVNRKDMTIIEEAKAYAQVIAAGKDIAECARLFGKRPEDIRFRMELLRLDEPLQELTARGQIGKNAAWYISRLSREGQYQVVRAINDGRIGTDATITAFCKTLEAKEAQPELFAVKPEQGAMFAAERKAKRNAFEKAWEKIEGMGDALNLLLEADPSELAEALGGDLELYRERMRLVSITANRTRIRLEDAIAWRLVQEG